MTGSRCPNCLIGVGQAITVLSNPAFTEDDSALVVGLHDGYQCAACSHVWVVGPEPAPSASAVCDFCGDREPTAAFACRDFVLDSVRGVRDLFTGPWAACPRCAELIGAGDRDGLVEHSVAMFVRRFPRMAADMPPGHLPRDTRRRFTAFWANRITEEEARGEP